MVGKLFSFPGPPVRSRAHRPAADDNSLIGCTSHDLTDDWSLASTHFVDSQYAFHCVFGCVLLWNQI